MKKSNLILSIIFLVMTLTSSTIAQYGLFDTLWVARNLYPSISDISPNDSLYLCFGDIRQTSDNKLLWSIGFHFNESRPPKFISGGREVMTSDIANDTLIGIIIWDAITGADKDFFYANIPGFPNDYSDIDSNAYLFFRGKTYKLSRKTRKLEIDSVQMPYWCGKVSKNGELVAGSYAVSTPDSIYWRNIQYAEVRSIKTGKIVLSVEISNSKSTMKRDTLPEDRYPDIQFSQDCKYIIINDSIYNLETKENIIKYNLYEKNGNQEYFRGFPLFMKESGKVLGRIDFRTVEGNKGHIDSIGYSILDLKTMKEKLIIYNPKSQMLVVTIKGNVFDDNTFIVQSLGKLSSYNSTDFQYLAGAGLVRMNYDYSSVENSEIPDSRMIYPNPAREDFILKLNLLKPQCLNFELVNFCGNTVKSFGKFDLESGLNFVNFKVSEMPSGNYFLKSTGISFTQTYKVVIVR